MTVPDDDSATPAPVSEQVADAVRSHPSVVRLDSGDFGVITTHLPGRRITGVRAGEGEDPVEVAVVLRADRPLPEVVPELRALVTEVTGAVPVDITVTDVDTET